MNIAFLGDIGIFDTGLLYSDWKSKLSQVREKLKKYDLVVANLEVPITNRKRTFACKGIHLQTSISIVDILVYLNVSVVSLANNHMCDFGLAGMNDTLKILDEAGIAYYGINDRDWICSVKGEKITFHGYCCYSTNGAKYINKKNQKGVCALTKDEIIKALEEDKKNERFSILSLHWGDEYSHYPNEKQVNFMHELTDKYGFLVHGHHAHVMQGIEKRNNSLIAYNQGNFCFDDCHSIVNPKLVIHQGEKNKESFILSVNIIHGLIADWSTIGIKYNEEGIEIHDNKAFLHEISESIKDCTTDEYKRKSMEMIRQLKYANRGVHDYKWFLSKLNYYSVGAVLVSRFNKKKYLKAF